MQIDFLEGPGRQGWVWTESCCSKPGAAYNKPEKPKVGDIAELKLPVTVSVKVTDINGGHFRGEIVSAGDDGDIGKHVEFSSKHVFDWMTGS